MIDITIPPPSPFSTGVTRHQLKKPSALKGQKAYFRGATLLHPSLREGLSFRGHKPTRSVLSSIPWGLITLPPCGKVYSSRCNRDFRFAAPKSIQLWR
jgi:hypothetical protein